MLTAGVDRVRSSVGAALDSHIVNVKFVCQVFTSKLQSNVDQMDFGRATTRDAGKGNLTAGNMAMVVPLGIPRMDSSVVAVQTSVHCAAAGIAAPRTTREMALMRWAALNIMVMTGE